MMKRANLTADQDTTTKRQKLENPISNYPHLFSTQLNPWQKYLALEDEFNKYLSGLVHYDYFLAEEDQLLALITALDQQAFGEQENEFLEKPKPLEETIDEIKQQTWLSYNKDESSESEDDYSDDVNVDDLYDLTNDVELKEKIHTTAEVKLEELQHQLATYRQKRIDLLALISPKDVDIDMFAFDVDDTLAKSLYSLCEIHRNYNSKFADIFEESFQILNGKLRVKIFEVNTEYDSEKIWDILYNNISSSIIVSGGSEGQKKWQEIFNKLHDSNRNIALVSFNPYRPIIYRFLKDPKYGLGLDSKLVDELIIVAGLPEDESIGKRMHIGDARDYLGLPDKKMSTTYLVDDSGSNCRKHKVDDGLALYLDYQKYKFDQYPDIVIKKIKEIKLFPENILLNYSR